jgi:hypothetical protein
MLAYYRFNLRLQVSWWETIAGKYKKLSTALGPGALLVQPVRYLLAPVAPLTALASRHARPNQGRMARQQPGRQRGGEQREQPDAAARNTAYKECCGEGVEPTIYPHQHSIRPLTSAATRLIVEQ